MSTRKQRERRREEKLAYMRSLHAETIDEVKAEPKKTSTTKKTTKKSK